MINDDMIHGAFTPPGVRRIRFHPGTAPGPTRVRNCIPTRQRAGRINDRTPIIPGIIAWCVCDEAAMYLGQPLPRRWIRRLVAEAETVYAHNERFRRRIRAAGNRGRDYLWMFMRHWLAALLHEHRSHLYARLPASFSMGEPLPMRPLRS